MFYKSFLKANEERESCIYSIKHTRHFNEWQHFYENINDIDLLCWNRMEKHISKNKRILVHLKGAECSKPAQH
jgi:hypothetical protein